MLPFDTHIANARYLVDVADVVAFPGVLALAFAPAFALAFALVPAVVPGKCDGLCRSTVVGTQMFCTTNFTRKSPTAAETTSGSSVYTQFLHWLLDSKVTWYPP